MSTYSEDSRQSASARVSSVGSETSYNYWAPPEVQMSAPSRPLSLARDESQQQENLSDDRLAEWENEQRAGSYPPVVDRSYEEDDQLTGLGLTGFAASSAANRNKAPPMLSLVVPGPELDIGSSLDTPSPRQPTSGALSTGSSNGKGGGWWDLISPTEQSPSGQVPWSERPQSSPGRSSLSPSGSGRDALRDRTSSQSIQSVLGAPPPPPALIEESSPNTTPPQPPYPADSPMTPQMEARVAQLMNPAMELDATPTQAPLEDMPRPRLPVLPLAAQEALAKLEGVRLHDESLAKLEGTHKPLPSIESIPLPQPHLPSKPSPPSKDTTPPRAKETTPPRAKESTPPRAKEEPVPPVRPATPEDDLYARLDFVPMDYNPMHKAPAPSRTGPIWPNKASDSDRLARSDTRRRSPTNHMTQKSNGGAPVWPRRKPSDAQRAVPPKDGPPPLSTVNESGSGSRSAGPNSAPLRGSDPAWNDTSEASGEGYSSLTRSATQGKRPPPVPTTMNRPGFPTPGAAPRRSTEAQRDSGGDSSVKSKFNTFINRSMTRREKENTTGHGHGHGHSHSHSHSHTPGHGTTPSASSGSSAAAAAALAHHQSQRRPKQMPVANNPGKWNRDMVAGIMGPPAERRQV